MPISDLGPVRFDLETLLDEKTTIFIPGIPRRGCYWPMRLGRTQSHDFSDRRPAPHGLDMD